MAIITKEYLKPFLDIQKDTKDYDELLTNLISVVSKDIVLMCNQEIESTSQTWEFSGNESNYITIPKFPVISITTLKSRSLPTDAWSSAIASSNYALLDNGISPKLYYQSGFIKGNWNYQLVYVSGYATIPDDIKQVAVEMCNIYFRNSSVKDGGRLGIASLGKNIQGIGTNTSFKDMTKDWQRRLSKYRRITI